jgi:hypothetical protein
VAARASKLIRLVDIEKFFVGMAYKGSGQTVGCLSRSIRSEIRSLNVNGLTCAKVANFAAVYDVVLDNAYLMTKD